MYEKTLIQVKKQIIQEGGILQPSCNVYFLKQLKEQYEKKLNFILLSRYAKFLYLMNGFYWNGVYIFANVESESFSENGKYIPSCIDENLKYRQASDRFLEYLVFGKSAKDKVLFVYDIIANEYQVIDENLSKFEKQESFDCLIEKAFRKSLY